MSKRIPITDPADPRIEAYTSIRERDLTGRHNRFIIEGRVTLEVALTRSRFSVESLLLSEKRADTLIQELAPHLQGIPVYVAPQSVLDQIAGFPMHRGILACGVKQDQLALRAWLAARPETSTLVVCIGTSNHDNTGAIFRNAAALGADAVLLDHESCDPLYRKSIRVSAGTALWLPYFHGEAANTLLQDIADANYAIWTLTPRETAPPIQAMTAPRRLAIVLGPEGPGLTDEQIGRGQSVRIPMANQVDSLNLATSLAITLSHAHSMRQSER